MAEVITDLGLWTDRLRAAVRALPKEQRAAVLHSARMLLAAGLRRARKHTGALRRSLRTVVRQVASGGVEIALTSDDPAAGDQEAGGTITAQDQPMAVPIGVERAHWDASGTRRTAREIPGLFRITAKDGKQYLVTNDGVGLVLRFALRDSVTQRRTRWATYAARDARSSVEPGIRTRFQAKLLARRST